MIEPTEEVIGGWIVHANCLGGRHHKVNALTAAYDNIGPKGIAIMLDKMKLRTASDVVEWLSK